MVRALTTTENGSNFSNGTANDFIKKRKTVNEIIQNETVHEKHKGTVRIFGRTILV